MRVVFAEYVADDGCGLFVWSAGDETELVHRVEHAPVNRLETVSDVGERARNDDAHGVIEE